ncbi:Ig-like domain-containing protein [Pyxidicoccus sp. QH1ED-7-1]|nr:Ig-like domain-containing protein [Pyxidicoccus xibeiensis]
MLLNTSPMGGATEVPTGTPLVLTFSEAMDTASIEVTLQPAVTLRAPTWNQQGSVLTLQHEAELAENTPYTMTVDGEDKAGNPLTGARTFSFTTTGPAPDTTPPTVLATSPVQSSIGNARNALLEVVFSEPMNKSAAEAAFSITSPAGFNSGSFSWNSAATVMTYSVPASFSHGAQVTWQVSTGARDEADNALAETMTRGFRVVRQGSLTVNFDPATSGSVAAPNYFRQTIVYNFEMLGDSEGTNAAYRLFLGFKLDGLPEDLTQISHASLSWWVSHRQGTPFENLGQLWLEPVDVGEQLELSIDEPNPQLVADYHAVPLVAGTEVLQTALGSPGIFNVTSSVVNDWVNRSARGKRTQYRLRFGQGTDNDGVRDVLISDAEFHPKLAELQVSYEYP